MADRKHGIAAPATTSTVYDCDWDVTELDGETFSNVLFAEVDMIELANRGAVFNECTFRATRFNMSVHTNAAFTNCTFTRCSFFGATFADCKLVGSMFDGCTYGLFEVHGGNWSFTGFPGADLRKAKFTKVRLREADLTGARLQEAEIRDCDMSGAWLHSSDLIRCDLRGSDLTGLDPMTVKLGRTVVDYQQAVYIAEAVGLVVHP